MRDHLGLRLGRSEIEEKRWLIMSCKCFKNLKLWLSVFPTSSKGYESREVFPYIMSIPCLWNRVDTQMSIDWINVEIFLPPPPYNATGSYLGLSMPVIKICVSILIEVVWIWKFNKFYQLTFKRVCTIYETVCSVKFGQCYLSSIVI